MSPTILTIATVGLLAAFAGFIVEAQKDMYESGASWLVVPTLALFIIVVIGFWTLVWS